jgi:20S proteasome alpha/beta subunit
MTFVSGFKCRDGVVLCADRLESDGVTKRYRYKLEGIDQNSEWGVSWGSAGDGRVIEKFTEKFKAALMPLRQFDLANIQLSAEAALTLVNADYPAHPMRVHQWGLRVRCRLSAPVGIGLQVQVMQ